MKYALSVLFFLVFILAQSPAQSVEKAAPAASAPAADAGPARRMTDELAIKYQLDSGQVNKMYTIQARKLRNLNEIESLKTDDPALYTSKLQSIQRGTQAGIRRMLTTKAQQDLFNRTQLEQRKQRSARREALQAQGIPREEIEAQLLSIYLE